MFAKEDCSYVAYKKILKDIKDTGRYCDYGDVLKEKKEQFLILRHDIEFSIERAYQLSEIESAEGIQSSYFVQITNNAYNAFSQKNIERIQEMNKAGHHIGLHYHRNAAVNDLAELKRDIVYQARLLAEFTGVPVDRFSFHRPLRAHLEADIQLEGMINTYGHQFFVMTDNMDRPLEVKYIADSNHQWKYGVANKEYFSQYDKIQLLIHPLSWSEKGAEHVENFRMLADEKRSEFIKTVEGEWKIFDQLRGKI